MNMGWGKIGIRVSVQGYTECNTLLFYLVFNMVLYIKMVKKRIVLFVCLFLGMLLLFLIGKYGRLPVRIKMLRRKWRERKSMDSQWCIQKHHGEWGGLKTAYIATKTEIPNMELDYHEPQTFKGTLPYFSWGFISFYSILTSITRTYDMFFILRPQGFSLWSHNV